MVLASSQDDASHQVHLESSTGSQWRRAHFLLYSWRSLVRFAVSLVRYM
jgi:hypothetical protein